ncbi:MAG: hypothetical protein PHE58_05045, partial [Candidatus Omnitrophica bacterium]|nr:hypothetical protein [Candidatus Omnitrophota bacterium]
MLRILEGLFQFILSLFVFVIFNKIFEFICTKGKPRYFKPSDILIEEKQTDTIILFSGLALLCVTIILNFLFKPLIGFYLSSVLFIWMGSSI